MKTTNVHPIKFTVNSSGIAFLKVGFNSVNVCPDRTVDDIDELIRS